MQTGDFSPKGSVARSGYTTHAVMISAAAAIGGFLFGFDTAVINGAVDAINSDFGLNPWLSGFVVAIALLGCAVGAWFAGGLADRWGRLRVMLLGAILFFLSSLGAGFAFAAWDLVIWRFMSGLGIGVASVISPSYISEIAPARLRGRLASLQQMAIVLGIFTAFLSDAFLATAAHGAAQPLWFGVEAWRWMFLVGIIPALVYGIVACRVPESPVYLVAKGDSPAATKVLNKLIGEEGAHARVRSIEKTVHSDKRKPRFKDLLFPKTGLLPIVWVGLALAVFQQLVGINVIFYYSTSLWQFVGFQESDSFNISVVTSIINVLVTIVAITLIDRVGRRRLLLIGSVGMAVSLLFVSLGFFQAITITGQGDGADVGTAANSAGIEILGAWGVITLVAANLFVVFFGLSWGPVMWVLLSEMFPNSIRAIAMAVATAANWLANWVVTATFPALSGFSLGFTYLLYTIFAAISFFVVYWKIPETRGVELENMSSHFKDF